MKQIILPLALALLVLAGGSVAYADNSKWTPRQQHVVNAIRAECRRQNVSEWGCLWPLFKAWQETKYGLGHYGDYRGGVAHSVGIFQWWDGDSCRTYSGLGCYGPYYQRYGLAWRENEAWDIEMGVRLLTQWQRGEPDMRGHWRVWAIPANWTPPPYFTDAQPYADVNVP